MLCVLKVNCFSTGEKKENSSEDNYSRILQGDQQGLPNMFKILVVNEIMLMAYVLWILYTFPYFLALTSLDYLFPLLIMICSCIKLLQTNGIYLKRHLSL
jgi:hypothetical protein